MTPSDIVELVEGTWSDTKPDKRMEALRNIRKFVPEDHLELYDALVDSKISGIVDDSSSIVLVLIHGIQTDGAWHHLVIDAFKDSPKINVVSLGYDCVTPLQLVGPVRRSPISDIERKIRGLKYNEPRARFMAICHSFGSYIFSKILAENSDRF